MGSGCQKPDSKTAPIRKEKPAIDQPGSGSSQNEGEAAPSTTLQPKPLKSNVRRAARPRRPILVGGCLEVCESPEEALFQFLSSALQGKGKKAVARFVDTSLLVYNGRQLGRGWATLWGQRKLAERQESIDKWLIKWLAWTHRIVDPQDRSERAIQEAVRVIEQDQSHYVVAFHRPELRESPGGGSTAMRWRIVLKPRGLEWLIANIDDRTQRKATER
jgi:hypothetical protein